MQRVQLGFEIVDEEVVVERKTGVVDQKPYLEPYCRLGEPREEIVSCEVRRDDQSFHGCVPLQFAREGAQTIFTARDENHVDPFRDEPTCERRTETGRSARDQRPGPVVIL